MNYLAQAFNNLSHVLFLSCITRSPTAELAGLVPLFFGANYLDYDSLPTQWINSIAEHHRTARAMGIWIVEIGVFLAVAGMLVVLYDNLTERFHQDD